MDAYLLNTVHGLTMTFFPEMKCSGSKVTKENCVECRCVSKKFACKQIRDCVAETRIRLSRGTNETLKMQIDAVKDRCVPGAIYT